MTRFLRTLLLCLLLAALSFQGIAAAAQLRCGLTEARAPAQTNTATHAHQHAAPALADAHHAHSHAGAQGDEIGHDTKHKHAGCSSCASCCAGAVAPPFAAVADTARHGSQPVRISLPSHAASFLPAGLERPPKPLST